MAIKTIKAALEQMVQEGNELEKFVARDYLQQIEQARIEDADFVVEVKRTAIKQFMETSADVVTSWLDEYCGVVELKLETGKSLLMVYLTPIDQL